jgi:hypothetical protein
MLHHLVQICEYCDLDEMPGFLHMHDDCFSHYLALMVGKLELLLQFDMLKEW